MEEIDGLEVDLSLLPTELEPLAPFIRRYAASDDGVRSDRVSDASVEELQALFQAVEPRWDAIEAYMDEYMERPGSPEQNVALVLSSLSEAAAEARLELERRGGGR
jgi:hypothetical protein